MMIRVYEISTSNLESNRTAIINSLTVTVSLSNTFRDVFDPGVIRVSKPVDVQECLAAEANDEKVKKSNSK